MISKGISSRDEGRYAPRVLFLLPGREEYVHFAVQLFHGLEELSILVTPFITHLYMKGDSEQLEESFGKDGISFETLDNWYNLNAIVVLQKLRVNAVVTLNDLFPVERSFAMACRYLGLPVVVIRESTTPRFQRPNYSWSILRMLSKMGDSLRYFREFSFFIRSMGQLEPGVLLKPRYLMQSFLRDFRGEIAGQFADYIMAATEQDASLLRKNCPHAREILVVGHPKYDEMIKSRLLELRSQSEVRELLGVPPRKKILLFLSGAQVEHGMWSAKEKAKTYEAIFALLSSLSKEFSVIVRLHPIEPRFILAEAQNLDFVTVTRFDLAQLIGSSDLVLAWPSTTNFNVVLAQKPLIVMDFLRELQDSLIVVRSIVDQQCCFKVTNIRELADAISNVTNASPAFQRMMDSQAAFDTRMQIVDGKSLERIAMTLANVLSETKCFLPWSKDSRMT